VTFDVKGFLLAAGRRPDMIGFAARAVCDRRDLAHQLFAA